MLQDQIVGTAIPRRGPFSGFVWDHGQITNLTFPGGVGSQAFAVNERGQVVGVSRTAAGPSHEFL